jgi:hypothetical protein
MTDYVIVQITQGTSVTPPLVGRLVYENDTPVAELLPNNQGAPLPAPTRLYSQHLVKDRDASAGVPAIYRHKTPLIAE